MKIVSNLNGNTKTTTYGNKLFYREGDGNYTQVRRAFYREGTNTNFTQVYQYDETAPTITITSSQDNTAVRAYTLTGRVTDDASGIVSVTINNEAVSIDGNGYFSKSYTLSEGNNTFAVYARDNAGNTNTVNANIYCENEADDNNHNWSQSINKGDNGYENRVYVLIDGEWILLKTTAHGESETSFVDARAIFYNQVFPLPKGLSSLSITASANGNRDGSGNVDLVIYDATTGTDLASASTRRAGQAVNVSLSLTQEQSRHNLQVKLDAEGDAYGYTYADAYAGIWDWSFNFY